MRDGGACGNKSCRYNGIFDTFQPLPRRSGCDFLHSREWWSGGVGRRSVSTPKGGRSLYAMSPAKTDPKEFISHVFNLKEFVKYKSPLNTRVFFCGDFRAHSERHSPSRGRIHDEHAPGSRCGAFCGVSCRRDGCAGVASPASPGRVSPGVMGMQRHPGRLVLPVRQLLVSGVLLTAEGTRNGVNRGRNDL